MNTKHDVSKGFKTTLLLSAAFAAGLFATMTPSSASAVTKIKCTAGAHTPLPVPGRKMIGTGYVTCVGVPVSLSVCTIIQFRYKDGTGKWRTENRGQSCTASPGKTYVAKTVTDHCVTGYYRTFASVTAVFPPNSKPPAAAVTGVSPQVRVNCY